MAWFRIVSVASTSMIKTVSLLDKSSNGRLCTPAVQPQLRDALHLVRLA
jgi:hypothetical protein